MPKLQVDPLNSKFISIGTIWEIAIKLSLRKIDLQMGFENFMNLIDENGFEIIPISAAHAIYLSSLEFHHKDPFDRLLVAQSKIEKFTIITKDEIISNYPINTIW